MEFQLIFTHIPWNLFILFGTYRYTCHLLSLCTIFEGRHKPSREDKRPFHHGTSDRSSKKSPYQSITGCDIWVIFDHQNLGIDTSSYVQISVILAEIWHKIKLSVLAGHFVPVYLFWKILSRVPSYNRLYNVIWSLTLSSLSLPLSTSSTTSRELLPQFSTCSGWRWFDVV